MFLNPRLTRMKTLLHLFIALVVLAHPGMAAPPVVSNVRAAQIAGTKNIEVLYDVSDADGDLLTIAMQVSGDAGQTYSIPATALSGHIGTGVASGANRRIIWNAGSDWNGQLVSNGKVRVTASDGSTPAPPPGMVYIPAGPFQMGDNLDGDTSAMPVHNVQVSGFFIDRFEVKKELWESVAAWGMSHGYDFGGTGSPSSRGNGHPMAGMYWFYAVKWCNARSEMEGLTPIYYTDDAQTLVYRSGFSDVTNARAKWSGNGYRLPTEAEWEKAARGALLGNRYPWGNSIDGSSANFSGSGDAFENPTTGDMNLKTTPVGYYNGSQTPVGVDMANGYALHDIAGNVREWCWDWYSSTYYGDIAANSDPHGPLTGTRRVVRGGGFDNSQSSLRVMQRDNNTPSVAYYYFIGYIGFRCVRAP